MIPRLITPRLKERLTEGKKIILLFGARQVGKTTLVRSVLAETGYQTLYVSGDEPRISEELSSRDSRRLRGLVNGYDALFVDEAQRVPEIGINLKILADQVPGIRVIATGSSSLDLASKTRESLTGRAWVHRLYPIAISELIQQNKPFEVNQQLEERLIYGSYPEIFSTPNDATRREYLETLVESYLYKDILDLSNVRRSDKIIGLLRLLAFQVGQQVSLNELGTQLGLSRDTVGAYIDLLEQSFVVFRLTGYSRNLRKEMSKQMKVYFWDMGVRNALINSFYPIAQRTDVGALWENFVISERRKWLDYTRTSSALYFWRTQTGAEIDLIEESNDELRAFECKWGSSKPHAPQSFIDAYPGSTYAVISRDNYLEYLGG
ncbi:MAG: ATP-binding protein [Chloroflexi bacterium]|nr:ATP-binding protein [Chloroflexota bacterium]